jgi:hypothetical protein
LVCEEPQESISIEKMARVVFKNIMFRFKTDFEDTKKENPNQISRKD